MNIRLYYHKTDGGAEYLCSSHVEGSEEGSFDSKYIVRIDGKIERDAELSIREEKGKCIHDFDNYGKCCDCGELRYPCDGDDISCPIHTKHKKEPYDPYAIDFAGDMQD